MIKQIFNSVTGSPSLSPINLSGDDGTLMNAYTFWGSYD